MMNDVISRQAAMEEISKQQTYKMFEGEDTLYLDANDVGSVLASLPSADLSGYSDKLWRNAYERGRAEAQQRWIPCSERLPEDGQDVLVTYKTTGKIHPCQYHDDGSRNPWYSYIDQCRAYMNVVLAWMPLPEPYHKQGGTV